MQRNSIFNWELNSYTFLISDIKISYWHVFDNIRWYWYVCESANIVLSYWPTHIFVSLYFTHLSTVDDYHRIDAHPFSLLFHSSLFRIFLKSINNILISTVTIALHSDPFLESGAISLHLKNLLSEIALMLHLLRACNECCKRQRPSGWPSRTLRWLHMTVTALVSLAPDVHTNRHTNMCVYTHKHTGEGCFFAWPVGMTTISPHWSLAVTGHWKPPHWKPDPACLTTASEHQ